MDALIGFTGFVGGNLDTQHSFTARFNSQNVGEMIGREFDHVVCAAAPGSMFRANRHPDKDKRDIEQLARILEKISSRRFTLISSIAVYGDFSGQDDEGSTAWQSELAYGKHRRELEAFCEHRFENCLVVRLPALYGAGLKKNFVFDILNPAPTMLSHDKLDKLLASLSGRFVDMAKALYTYDDCSQMFYLDRQALNGHSARSDFESILHELDCTSIQFHSPETTFQYYGVESLWDDIQRCANVGLSSINLATEPVRAGDIYHRLTKSKMPETKAKVHGEDMRTRHADLWERQSFYIEDADSVLSRLTAFASRQRG